MQKNILKVLLDKLSKEYKALLEHLRQAKPFKIIEISNISSVPGETKFVIQILNKNSIVNLSAAEIIGDGYNLNNFNNFHAEMIRQALLGKILEFLKLSETEPKYKIISKKYDRESQQYFFTIASKDKATFILSADELSKDKILLYNMNIQDIYDIGYTHGSEAIIKEKTALLLAKNISTSLKNK
jgi:hypothetical protein